MSGSRSTETISAKGYDHLVVRRVHLSVIEGAERGQSYQSSGGRVVIGTHKSSDFVLSDATVSRFHCEIDLGADRPILRDLGSRNGSLIDGVRVHEAPLAYDAPVTLTLGRTLIRLVWGERDVTVPLSPRERFGLLVGRSPMMRAVFVVLERAAATDSTVLITGETGTGKDLAAESIHLESARRRGPFVVVDCGAIPANLLEAELFGHERGAFTGADRPREGAFESASGGTIFIDEIGELPLELQPKLLRVLDRKEVQRIGGTRRVPVDARVVAATNRNLRGETNARRFRADLYFRVAVLQATLPALRERREDLPLLVDALLASLDAESHPLSAKVRSRPFLSELERHDWPGNVRELKNFLERYLALEGQAEVASAAPSPEMSAGLTIDVRQPLREARERFVQHFERRFLEALLRHHGNNVSEAARAAGIARVHFYRLMSKCGLR
jgi:DNA-binding NtrC family response regulator